MSLLENIEARQLNDECRKIGFFNIFMKSVSESITGKTNCRFSKDTLNGVREFLKQSNFEYGRTSAFEQEQMFLGLVAIMAEMNDYNLKKIFVLNKNNELELNCKNLNATNINDALINLTQKTFMYNKKLLGIVPIRHLILDDKKKDKFEKHKDVFEKCFESLKIHKKSEYNIDEIIEDLKKGEKLKLRILGTNHFFLKTEFYATQDFLEKIPEEYRKQITVELLSKSGINNAFHEDKEPELDIMKKMSSKYLKSYGVQIIGVDGGKHANTLDTIVTADKIDNEIGLAQANTLYFLCPNALNRQKYDIELHNLKNYSNVNGNSSKIYYDNCGGYKQLEKDLQNKSTKNAILLSAIELYEKEPTIENLKLFVEINKKYEYLVQDYQKAQNFGSCKKHIAINKIKKEVQKIKEEKEKNQKIIENFSGIKMQISNALCETAKQSFVSREIQRRKEIRDKRGRY